MKTPCNQKIRLTVGLVLSMSLLSGPVWAQNAEAQGLFATAKLRQEQAQRLRGEVAAWVQQANDAELQASADERDARILSARALQMLKADANKQRAYQLRQEARELWLESHQKLVDARNAEQKSEQFLRNVREIQKAGAQVADQPAIAATLQKDAMAQSAAARQYGALSRSAKAEAATLDQRAEAAWAQAQQLDPETHALLAAKPPKPELHPAVGQH